MTYREAAWTFLRGTKVLKTMDNGFESPEALKAMDGMSYLDYLRAVVFLSHMSDDVKDEVVELKCRVLLNDTIWMERLERLAKELTDGTA